MQSPRTTPRAVPTQTPPTGRGRWILGSVGLALATLGFLTVPRWFDRREQRKYKAAVQARESDLQRWQGWLEAGSCLRHDDGARWLAALDQVTGASTSAALGDAAAQDPIVDGQCLAALGPLETDPALPAAAQTAVHDWIAADRALGQPAEKPPDELRRLIGARDRVLKRVRGELLPPVHAAIRKVQANHGKARDYVWWRLELGFLLEEVLDLGTVAHHDGRDVAAAVRAPLHRLLDKIRDANAASASTREMPAIDVLARAADDAAWPALHAIEDNGAWNELEHDRSIFGVMPAEPQGCDLNQG